jgi:hypothetical protein
MRLIDTTTLEVRLFMSKIPEYVILSHTWGGDEVTFESMQEPDRITKASEGYVKIKRCCELAREDGYRWAWVDTCCIDKRSSAELSEAINSMYRYYWDASKCYAYLSDVAELVEATQDELLFKSKELNLKDHAGYFRRLESTQGIGPKLGWQYVLFIDVDEPEVYVGYLKRLQSAYLPQRHSQADDLNLKLTERLPNSRWFERGWTLQELLAPAIVEFYDKDWRLLGTKASLAADIEKWTRINTRYILDRSTIRSASLGLRFSWVSNRQTTREEDIAYCLMGIVGVNMPLLYGEGNRAFRRLQIELLMQTRDHTIFAWSAYYESRNSYNYERFYRFGLPSFLAPSPGCFDPSSLADIRPTFSQPAFINSKLEMTGLGLRITLPCIERSFGMTAILDCVKGTEKQMGVLLVERGDGRYQRHDFAGPEEISPEEVKDAVLKELCILVEDWTDEDSIAGESCAVKVENFTIKHVANIETCALEVLDDKWGVTPVRDVRALCDEVVLLTSLRTIGYIVKLPHVCATVLFSHSQGQSWLQVVLSETSFTTKEQMDLASELNSRQPLQHLRDYAVATIGTKWQIQARARKKIVHPHEVSCWHLTIHIRGPDMPQPSHAT